MYHVKVYTIRAMAKGKPLDTLSVPFGQFKEIGFWLDNCGYNEPDFWVIINFTTER